MVESHRPTGIGRGGVAPPAPSIGVGLSGRGDPAPTAPADRLERAMIRGVHTMFYSSEPEALRAFLRDKLGFPATDVGGGWLIFDLPEADMGCHPADEVD